jgi:segregation and condensation protein A
LYNIDDKDFDEKEELKKENNFILNLDIDGFNGPLDLLLQLAQTKKLDVTKISILELVDQYLGFIKKVKELDLHIASDYLVMAAILAYIKSKMLLPDQDEGSKDIPPLPEILEFNLKRLNAMRKCADSFSKRKLLNETRFLKGQILDQSIVLETEYYCSSKNLIICFANIFNRKSSKTINLITKNYYSIENAIERIRELYNSYKDWTPINTFFPKFSGTQIFKNEFKIAMISTISASLELAKQGEVNLKQEKEFGEILLKKRK